jgi:hypothetical protein
MKWLEGWFGTASGGMGALIIAIISIIVPVNGESSGSQVCSSFDGGPTTCSTSTVQTSVQGPQSGLLILILIAFLLFLGVLIGTWLDLNSRRTAGRLILLISVSLLLPMSLLLLVAAHGAGGVVALAYPFILLAFATGILACVRRDAPRSVALSTPQIPVTVQE